MVLQKLNSIYDDPNTKDEDDVFLKYFFLFGFILLTILTILTTNLCFDMLKHSDGTTLFLITMISLDSWSFVPYVLARHISKKSRNGNTLYQTDNYKWIENSFLFGFISTTILTILTAIIYFDMVEKIKPVPLEFLTLMILFDIWSFVLYLIACNIVKVSQNDNTLRKTDIYKSLENPLLLGFISTTILTILTAIAYFNIVEIPHVSLALLIVMILFDIGSFFLYLIAFIPVEESDNTPYKTDDLVRYLFCFIVMLLKL